MMEIKEIKIKNIVANPNQPRKVIRNIGELSCSMKELGQLTPISVFELDEKQKKKFKTKVKYMISNGGERRWRAAKRLNWETLKAIVEDPNEFAMLAENVARADMNILEKMLALNKIFVKKYGEKWRTKIHLLSQNNDKMLELDKIGLSIVKDCNAIGITPFTAYVSYNVISIPKETQKVILDNPDYFTDGVIRKISVTKGTEDFLTSVASEICEKKMISSKAMTHIARRSYNGSKSDFEIFEKGFLSYFRGVKPKLEDFLDDGTSFKEEETFAFQKKLFELKTLSEKCLQKCRKVEK